MFRRNRFQDDPMDIIWQDVKEIQDTYVDVLNRIVENTMTLEELGNFLRMLVDRSNTIQKSHRFAQLQGQASERLPIEAEVICSSLRHIFTSCCVAHGFEDHIEINGVWAHYERELRNI